MVDPVGPQEPPTLLRSAYRKRYTKQRGSLLWTTGTTPQHRVPHNVKWTSFAPPGWTNFAPPLTDGVLQGAAYFDAEGPLKPEWRKAESSWALAPEQEIASVGAKIRELRKSGDLVTYLAEYDAKRLQVGQTTYFVARKVRRAEKRQLW